LSLEPLIGPLPDIPVKGIDWVIVGGESGPDARPMKPDWVREIRDVCLQEEVPFFFKQWEVSSRNERGESLMVGHGIKCPQLSYPPHEIFHLCIDEVQAKSFRSIINSELAASGKDNDLIGKDNDDIFPWSSQLHPLRSCTLTDSATCQIPSINHFTR